MIRSFLKIVEESGREMVVQGSISADVAEALKMQLMSVKKIYSLFWVCDYLNDEHIGYTLSKASHNEKLENTH